MTFEEVFQGDRGRVRARGLGLPARVPRRGRGRLFVLDHAELEAGLGNAVESEDLHGDGRAGFLEAFALPR